MWVPSGDHQGFAQHPASVNGRLKGVGMRVGSSGVSGVGDAENLVGGGVGAVPARIHPASARTATEIARARGSRPRRPRVVVVIEEFTAEENFGLVVEALPPARIGQILFKANRVSTHKGDPIPVGIDQRNRVEGPPVGGRIANFKMQVRSRRATQIWIARLGNRLSPANLVSG
jgi:hypothetical protein